jgi:YbbR domain-containing protein
VWLALLLEHPWAKLLSLFLAGAIWLYVQGEEIHDTRVRSEVEWHLPAGLMAVEPPPEQVTLTVRGARSVTRRARDAPVRLVVDLTDIGVGEHSFELASITPQGLPSGVEVLAVAPSSVRFVLDEVASRRVEVEPVLIGEPEEGFEISDISLEPDVVEVRGPRSSVVGLTEVLTQPIDVTGVLASGTREVGLDLPRGVTLEGLSPSAHISVRSRRERRTVEGVPVHVRGAWDWRPVPDTVEITLEGPASALADVRQEELAAFVVLPDPGARSRFEAWWGPRDGVRLEVLHPPGVEVAAVQPPSVAVAHPPSSAGRAPRLAAEP